MLEVDLPLLEVREPAPVALRMHPRVAASALHHDVGAQRDAAELTGQERPIAWVERGNRIMSAVMRLLPDTPCSGRHTGDVYLTSLSSTGN
jgi:hypothetical protein